MQLICILGLLRLVLIIGCHILHGQHVIFDQSGFHQELYTEDHCMRKELGTTRKLGREMHLLFKEADHWYKL
jgi:hypothetical protein